MSMFYFSRYYLIIIEIKECTINIILIYLLVSVICFFVYLHDNLKEAFIWRVSTSPYELTTVTLSLRNRLYGYA